MSKLILRGLVSAGVLTAVFLSPRSAQAGELNGFFPLGQRGGLKLQRGCFVQRFGCRYERNQTLVLLLTGAMYFRRMEGTFADTI